MQLRLDEKVGTPISPESRDAFGIWLSGFVDGEGCFTVRQHKSLTSAAGFRWAILFSLALRADDIQILHEIHRFWGVGSVRIEQRLTSKVNAKPCAVYQVRRLRDHRDVLVPHFLRYPLRAKKARDFELWRKAVQLQTEVAARPTVSKGGRFSGGAVAKWQDADNQRMAQLVQQLREGRKYDGDLGCLPGPPPVFRFEEATVSEDLQGDLPRAPAGDLVVTAAR
ncbi:MAG: LAGLIDADG family homing endonuclease [Armatimonadota bacterium]